MYNRVTTSLFICPRPCYVKLDGSHEVDKTPRIKYRYKNYFPKHDTLKMSQKFYDLNFLFNYIFTSNFIDQKSKYKFIEIFH